MSSSRPSRRRATLRLAAVGVTLGLAVVFIVPALVATAASRTVDVLASTYSPATFSVAAGTTVVFRNTSQLPHTATADNGSFDTGRINPGASKSIVVKKAGKVAFYCQFHGGAGGVGQSGTITVTAAARGTTPRATLPSTDTRPDVPGPVEGLPLAMLAAAGSIAVLLAFGLDGAGRTLRRRSGR